MSNNSLIMFWLVLVLVVLTGCTPATTSEETGVFNLPYELRDCKVLKLTKDGMSKDRLYIIQCPQGFLGTSSMQKHGKSTTNVTTSLVEI